MHRVYRIPGTKKAKCFPVFPGFISNMTIQRQFFPNDEDQTGAAKALLRLQDTYNLDTDTLSRGNLPGKSHCCSFQKTL